LTLAELVERQITYADFSVDASAVELIRFKKNAFETFSGGSLVAGHSGVNWHKEEQHVFSDGLSRAANVLIVHENEDRCMRFHEFRSFLAKGQNAEMLEPFPELLAGFSPEQKPLFWLRLVAYGYLCNEYINSGGASIGFETREFPLTELLLASKDREITKSVAEYERRCRAIPSSPL
jgi:hypothetical protein